jgi:hypothetical protein
LKYSLSLCWIWFSWQAVPKSQPLVCTVLTVLCEFLSNHALRISSSDDFQVFKFNFLSSTFVLFLNQWNHDMCLLCIIYTVIIVEIVFRYDSFTAALSASQSRGTVSEL